MKMATLKTGKTVPAPLVETTTIALYDLIERNPIAFYEFVELCKDSRHRIWGEADILYALALLQRDGSVQEDVRNIVLASVEGDGLELSLVSPM